jgi:hypothetical protein
MSPPATASMPVLAMMTAGRTIRLERSERRMELEKLKSIAMVYG